MALKQSSETLRRPQKLLWIVFPVIAIGSLIIGYIGFGSFLYRAPEFGHRPLDRIYYDLQLFVLGSDPLQQHASPYPLTLEIARFAAPAVTIYAVIEAIRRLLAVELSRIKAHRAVGHAIVCGDTAIADTLTRRLQANGVTVVEIRAEIDEFVSPGEPLRIVGDARDPEVLEAAGVRHAAQVYACAEGSASNVAIALTVIRAAGTAAASRRSGPLQVHSLVADSDFCATVQAFFLGRPTPGRVRLDFFNIDQIAARRLFADDQPVALSGRPPRILVAGTDGLGRAILIEAARCWRMSSTNDGQQLPVTLVGRGATAVVTDLTWRYPFLDAVCQLTAVEGDLLSLMGVGRLREPPDRVLITHQDEEYALKTAMTAERYWRGRSGPITVRLDGALIGGATSSGRLEVAVGTLHMFGAVAAAGDPDLIEDDLTERLARVLHDRYLLGRRARGDVPSAGVPGAGGPNGSNQPGSPAAERAMVAWDHLPVQLREANRAAAEDIGRKLAHIGYVITPRQAEQEEAVLTDSDIEQLVLMEHDRWCADLQRAGWRYGSQLDEERKLHPGLLGWAELPQNLRLRNYDPIRELPAILGDAGFQIVRA